MVQAGTIQAMILVYSAFKFRVNARLGLYSLSILYDSVSNSSRGSASGYPRRAFSIAAFADRTRRSHNNRTRIVSTS